MSTKTSFNVVAGSLFQFTFSYIVKPGFRPLNFNMAYKIEEIVPPLPKDVTISGAAFSEAIVQRFLNEIREFQSPLTVYTRVKIQYKTSLESSETLVYIENLKPLLRGNSDISDGLRGTCYCRLKRENAPVLVFSIKDFLIKPDLALKSDFCFNKFIKIDPPRVPLKVLGGGVAYTFQLSFHGKTLNSVFSEPIFIIESFQ